MRKLLIFSIIILTHTYSFANVKLPGIFTNHMVLQRNAPIHVWGWALANEKVSVNFHNQSKTTKADKNGNWTVALDNESAGGPYSLSVSGKNSLIISDVLVGEVWVCSGQSNMEFKLSSAANADAELLKANYPEIRELNIKHNPSYVQEKDVLPTEWKVCTPQNAANFTAVGYFFALKLQKELNVPIGLINSSWGGTMVETWTSLNALLSHPDFKEMLTSDSRRSGDPNQDFKIQVRDEISKFENNKINATDVSNWKNENYNDADWSKLNIPQFWEQQGLPNFDGVMWLRKEVILTADQIAKDAIVQLGKIDDSDESYFNGVKIGESVAKPIDVRRYVVPAKLLKAGKNVISIKVIDTGGWGGITGDKSSLSILTNGENIISLAGDWKAKVDTAQIQFRVEPNSYPSLLYNGMIHPLTPFTIKGVIWYQGEANEDRAYQYNSTFPLLINDWRKQWNEGDFPFYFVQLTSYNAHQENGLTGSRWAEVRESQTKTLSVANTGMAVIIDIGNPNDIHPTNKQDVGYRLAINALNKSYNKNIICSGPFYESMSVSGNKITITFATFGSKLKTLDKYGYLKGFQIAGKNKEFKWAKAYLQDNKVIVSCEYISDPVAVRYAWVDDASEADLFNNEGLPVAPFRTDDWPGLTFGKKYSIIK